MKVKKKVTTKKKISEIKARQTRREQRGGRKDEEGHLAGFRDRTLDVRPRCPRNPERHSVALPVRNPRWSEEECDRSVQADSWPWGDSGMSILGLGAFDLRLPKHL